MEESGVDAVTDYLVACDAARVVYTWCATRPRNYKAVIKSSAAQRRVTHMQHAYYLPDYDSATEMCTCNIRVDHRGVFLNDFSPSVPLWMAVWQARLLYRLFGPLVELYIVDLDNLCLETLLKEWENTSVRVRSITSKRRFTACVSRHRRTTGQLFHALSELQTLELLPSPYEDASLAVVEYIPSLRNISANACRVEYLKPLRGLHQLRELQIAQTKIRDRELQLLAELPLLTTLGISACSQLTSLNPLSRSPSLRVLRAANCERLVRVAQLSSVTTLRVVDLSENMFLPSELASFLSRQPLKVQLGYFLHLRWPRENPENVQSVLSAATHLYLSYCTLPNIRWLCGAHNLEQLYLNHTNVTATDMGELALHVPFLRVLSLSYCEHLLTDLSFTRSLPQLTVLTISRSSLPATFPELENYRRLMTVSLL
jgi:hypothetical protein